MFFELDEHQVAMQDAVGRLCARFPDSYWAACEEQDSYPDEFATAMASAGWLSVLIPEKYGGGGGGMVDAAIILEAVNRAGASGSAVHAQMYTMGTILRHGSEEQKQWLLPQLARNEVRLQAFGVTEADAGSDTTRIRTFARRDGDHYVIDGAKMWTSRVQHSDLLLLLCRTTRLADVTRKTDGMSLFLVDLHDAGGSIEVRPIRTMTSHETNELAIRELRVPASALVGDEGRGFGHLLSGLNAERVLVASECIGDGFWFIDRAVEYAQERTVFGRPIGANQGVQFPLADSYARLAAASTLRFSAAASFDAGKSDGFEANAAKYLASTASWSAANAAMDVFGGYGLAKEFGIERKFRDARLPLVTPVSNNLVLSYISHHVLGLPRSY